MRRQRLRHSVIWRFLEEKIIFWNCRTMVYRLSLIHIFIKKKGISYLPEKLQDIALVRIDNPDASLQELGEMLNPPLGKSGVNHRLRKICQIADDLKG